MTLFLFLFATCGDNSPGVADSPLPDASAGLPYVEIATIGGYNQASETLIAASGNDVVVTTIDQAFPSADSFVVPTGADDPTHPFRMVVIATSHDRGGTFSAPRVLVGTSCTDPLIASSADGSFWGGCNSPDLTMPPHSDLLRSTDGGDTFVVVSSPAISDKGWITIDETRHAVWVTGFPAYRLYSFDGTQLGAADNTGGVSAAFSDANGLHFIGDDEFQISSWDGISAPIPDGEPLPTGDQASDWTKHTVSMGRTASGQMWIIRAIRDSVLGSPIVARIRQATDAGSDVPISPAGTIGFLPAATLDDQGRLHAVWYDSSGVTGRLMYSHSVTTDLQGSYTTPVVVDANACPGGGWYPYEPLKDPPGGRRLREYVGIAITGTRAVISWTHAPDPPSRLRVAHIDF